MSDSQITIFYSWQSDLPGNETRNIIQDGIKDAVRLLRDTVDIEADRDTKGEYGSPDIANTIFSKIDECDIFVADVSVVCKYEVTDKDGASVEKLINVVVKEKTAPPTTVSQDGSANGTKTGDTMPIGMLAVLMLAAGLT